MTKEQALKLMGEYAEDFALVHCRDTTLVDIASRWPEDGSEAKAMRWLGFMQGACYVLDAYTLEELKEHSRKGTSR